MEIYGNQLISMESMDPGPQSLTSCGALWHPVAPFGGPLDAPKKPLQAGRPQIIRSSDVGIIGWSDLGDHQWSNLRSSAVWLCCQRLTGQMVDDERNGDEKNDWKKFSHARAWGARRISFSANPLFHDVEQTRRIGGVGSNRGS